jgi:hypothetical protein
LIARHARRPFAVCTGGRTDVCRPEHSFLYWYEYVHWRVSWPRMASGYTIYYNYGYFYLWRQSRRKLSGYVFLLCKESESGIFSIFWKMSILRSHVVIAKIGTIAKIGLPAQLIEPYPDLRRFQINFEFCLKDSWSRGMISCWVQKECSLLVPELSSMVHKPNSKRKGATWLDDPQVLWQVRCIAFNFSLQDL